MKVRWKQYEMILVNAAFAAFVTLYLWNHFVPAPGGIISYPEAAVFSRHHVNFNLFRNLILPQLGWLTVCYLAYLLLNRWVIPAVWRKSLLARIGWTLFAWLALSAVLSAAFTISVYLKDQWRYLYPDFSFFYIGRNKNEEINMPGIIAGVMLGTALFWAYISVREILIAYIEKPGNQRHQRVMIVNQLAIFIGTYLLFILLAQLVFGIHFEHSAGLFSIPLTAIFLGFMNIYYFFPKNEGRGSFSGWLWLLLLSMALTIVITFLAPGGSELTFPVSVVFQLLVITPLSWVLYRQQKDHILAFRGMEMDLSQTKADMALLRSQVNPHFLFNTLNTIYSTALDENAARTAKCLQMLGDMMRFMLNENNADFIQLSREIAYLEGYVELQKMRLPLAKGAVISLIIEIDNKDHQIAPMLLIPLIENAFKHGISFQKPSPIKINLAVRSGGLTLSVINHIQLLPEEEQESGRSGIGLNNVRQRLKLIYPGKHNLNATQDGEEFITLLYIQLSSNN